MAYNTKKLKTDLDLKPTPQYYNTTQDDYEVLEGQHGAAFATLKDASGNVVSPATETTLEQVKAELEAVKAELAAIKANQTSGEQKVTLSGTNETLLSLSSTGQSVSSYSSCVATVKLGWGTGHFEGSYDGGITYTPVAASRVETGTTYFRIDSPGQYFIDLRGVTHLKYIADNTIGGTGPHAASAALSVSYEPPRPSIIRKASKIYAPSPPRILGTPKRTPSDRTIEWLDRSSGTLYAIAGPNVSKSTDYGETYTTVVELATPTPWGTASFVGGKLVKLDNGKLLAIITENGSGNTDVYLSDENETNWVLVDSYPKEGVISPGYGFDVCGEIIVYANYKQPRTSADPINIRLSTDGGTTWKIIHTAPSVDLWHYHDVAYDPYRNRIWFCNGDYYGLANVYYSDDMGATWESVWVEGACPTQFTTIHPMPDCVIFGTDQAGFQGAYRLIKHDADKGSILKHVVEPAYSRRAPGQGGDATYRYGNYYSDGAAYWISGGPNSVIGTKDGVSFYTLWSQLGTPMVSRVIGVSDDGKIVLVFNLQPGVGLLVVDAPTWVEI